MRRLLLALLLVASCTGGSGDSEEMDRSATLWLCHPSVTDDPCDVPLTTTAVRADGTTAVLPATRGRQDVDCFYVYPTVSQAQSTNAPLEVTAAERNAATAQAAAFSSTCRVWAPVYRQLTVQALSSGKYMDTAARAVAHRDVVAAWHDYLSQNPDRRFVLIGHSQGTLELLKLLQEEIDGDPALRKRLVSALLVGGFVQVAPRKAVGGDLENVPLCTAPRQTSCVVAYNAYGAVPPALAVFGRPDRARGTHAACTNPAALAGGPAALQPLFPATARQLLPGAPAVSTTFLSYPGYATAECRTRAGSAWLQVTVRRVAGDTRPAAIPTTLGPAWGLHVVDVSVALGDLVDLVRQQSG